MRRPQTKQETRLKGRCLSVVIPGRAEGASPEFTDKLSLRIWIPGPPLRGASE
jgi:hypothetical protein